MNGNDVGGELSSGPRCDECRLRCTHFSAFLLEWSLAIRNLKAVAIATVADLRAKQAWGE